MEGLYGEHVLRVKVAAPSVDGKANAEIKRFVSKLLAGPLSRVSITKGAASRDKDVLLQGIGFEKVRKDLAALVR